LVVAVPWRVGSVRLWHERAANKLPPHTGYGGHVCVHAC